MKTGKYYLNLLPDDIKDEFNKEFSLYRSLSSLEEKKEFLERDFSHFGSFIAASFVWFQTKNGGKFWKNISDLGEEYFIQNKRDQKLKELGI